jgi:hypothetical protein
MCTDRSFYIMLTSTATAIYIPGGLFCVPSGVSTHFYTFWIPMLAFESLLCTLALIRGFQTYRAKGSLFHSSRQLVGILIRDSVLYFLVCVLYFHIFRQASKQSLILDSLIWYRNVPRKQNLRYVSDVPACMGTCIRRPPGRPHRVLLGLLVLFGKPCCPQCARCQQRAEPVSAVFDRPVVVCYRYIKKP